MPEQIQRYRCIYCDHNTVMMKKEDRLVCSQCDFVYPMIDGIPVLTRRAPQFVVAQAEELNKVRGKLKHLQEIFSQLSISEKTPALFERISRMVNGTALNIALLDKQCEAIWAYAQNESGVNDTVAWATTQNGYPFEELLPYFYQDWHGTKPFASVIQNILPAVEAFCDDRDSLAVFGVGACGLLYALSDHFDKSVGVDLALPGLIMAKHLIEGEQFSLCLQNADWMNIELSSPQSKGKSPGFVAANVMDTPFTNESLSTVITQYLIDIVPNAEWFIQEIHRILKPGGVWINFSKPFTWPSDNVVLGPRQLSEIPSILQDQGFDTLQLKMTRFNVLSMEDIFQGGERFDQEVHMFVARKSESALSENRSLMKGRIRKRKEEIWHQIPRLVKFREIAIVDKTVYGTGLQEHIIGVQVQNTFIPMAHDFLSIISTLLEGIDSKRTVQQLQNYLQERGVVVPDSDFIDLMYCLNVEYYLLEFTDDSTP